MSNDLAETAKLGTLMQDLGKHLDTFLEFKHDDALVSINSWQPCLDIPLPEKGCGIDKVAHEINQLLVPNGSAIPNPGCTSFITTGATSAGALANLAAAVAAPQRIGMTAFNFLEEKSLQWLADLFELPSRMKGIYSSGGSVANIVGLGAARQFAFERIGINPAMDGVRGQCRVYATEASHRTVHRAIAVLGMGQNSVVHIKTDRSGRMCTESLKIQIQQDIEAQIIPMAIVANAGATSTGAIDPLAKMADLAQLFDVWFHIDGAYGLPGILAPKIRHLYDGLERADSVTIDPHKWLGAPVGVGATFVRDRNLLSRAFSQGASDYLEGSVTNENVQHSMDSLGIPYSDFGVELSAPCRGAVVWALIREIGKEGMRARICRHIAMARWLANKALAHPNLELLMQPTLSICCFRYVSASHNDLNELNKRIHRQLVQNGTNIPSTAVIDEKIAIRPCFVGARTNWQHVYSLLDEVLAIGQQFEERINNTTEQRKVS